MNKSDIYKAAGILIQDRRLLVERSKGKDFYIAPGGKLEAGETAKQALVRELMEEFCITVHEHDLQAFGTFTATAAGQNDRTVHMTVFSVTNWEGTPTLGHNVKEIHWITSKLEVSPVGSIFEHEVIPRLKAVNLIG